MLSNKPYLIRAFYEWIVDSKFTPLIVVDTTLPNATIPENLIENGELILNVSPVAVRDLKLGAKFIEFRASFSGVAHLISVPVKTILAIYAEENGQGMYFDLEEDIDDVDGEQTPPNQQEDKPTKSHLKLVD